MEVFEVHITGDESIIDVCKDSPIKTIAVDLLRPDLSHLRTEYMTSQIFRFENFSFCKKHVDRIVSRFLKEKVSIFRIKIESPYYPHYVESSLYMESHFPYNRTKNYPISKSQHKSNYLMTDRTYSKDEYDSFRKKYANAEIELCLYDTNVKEDEDWFELYGEEHGSE